jgi:hypothetical protein
VAFVIDKVALGQLFSVSTYIFPVSLPFHECTILIHTSIIDAGGGSVGILITVVSEKWKLSEKVDLCGLQQQSYIHMCREVTDWQQLQWLKFFIFIHLLLNQRQYSIVSKAFYL